MFGTGYSLLHDTLATDLQVKIFLKEGTIC